MPAPKLLTGTHDSEMVKPFINACNMYFKLTGISDENTKALFAKTRMSDTAHTWYDSQGYDKITVIFATIKFYILNYFIPSEYVKRCTRALVVFKMG